MSLKIARSAIMVATAAFCIAAGLASTVSEVALYGSLTIACALVVVGLMHWEFR